MISSFPTGIIQKVKGIISKYNLKTVVKDSTLRRNIAYTFQFIDLVEWLLNDTDIGLTVKEQVIKYGIVALDSIMESILRDYLEYNRVKPSKKTKRNINKLAKLDCPAKVVNSLSDLHKKRNKIHLHLWRNKLEYKKYKVKDFRKAKKDLFVFMKWISKEKWGNSPSG